MSRESSKAYARRFLEQRTGIFNWDAIFKAPLIDIGPGDDPYPKADKLFDQKDGDANKLSSYVPAASFATLHASQSLEHMHNPFEAVLDWAKVVRPGGCLVITVPSWELYEGMIWPSRYNPDHKSTWSLWQKASPAPHHVEVPRFVSWLEKQGFKVLRCELCDRNYDYKIGTKLDQTWHFEDAVEAFIELVIQKPL